MKKSLQFIPILAFENKIRQSVEYAFDTFSRFLGRHPNVGMGSEGKIGVTKTATIEKNDNVFFIN